MGGRQMDNQYEVLNPWAEVDPIPLRGISPRLAGLQDKTVGLFINGKIAARPSLNLVEKKLQERFPTLKFSRFTHITNDSIAEAKDKAEYEAWTKGVDAVVLGVG